MTWKTNVPQAMVYCIIKAVTLSMEIVLMPRHLASSNHEPTKPRRSLNVRHRQWLDQVYAV